MKILFVTPFLPSPARFGGQRRLDGLMRSLAKHHQLSLISFSAGDEFRALSIEATRAYCRDVFVFPGMDPEHERDKRLLQLGSLLTHRSYEHWLVARRREFLAELQRQVDQGDFDIVQIEFCQMAALRFERRRDRRYRVVLDEHNIEFDIVKRTATAEVSKVRQLYSAVDWRKLKREEQSAWRWVDGVSVTSERDARILSELNPETRVAVVPNGVDVDAFQPNLSATEPESLLFFGAMNYYPNHDGITYFLEQIFPKILARRPNIKLRVVGPAPDSVKALQNEHVEVTGFVDAVEPYIDKAAAVIVPLRIGGGTRLKIVEAMAKGKPIISTRIGAEGIDVRHEQHALLADEPADFAAQVERVLSDPQLAQGLGRAARELAEQRYGWPALVTDLERFYEQLLSRPPAAG